jgi:hypothetical protein
MDYTGYNYVTFTKMSYSNTGQDNLAIITGIILLEWLHDIMGGGM